MKKSVLLVLGVALLLKAPQVFAGNYGMAGCGLGALAFRDQPGKIQILVATLNNIVSPQTSAITSGTSNCFEDGNSETAALFITVNQVALQKDISRGNGETISALSEILGCSDSNRLAVALHDRYQSIFPKTENSATAVNQAIHSAIQNDASLVQSCKS